MNTVKSIPVDKLSLDLHNFRTVDQPNEKQAINALIAIHPDWFWALMDSLLEDGYSPTENIIVVREGKRYWVKEGNRRIASLKLILGLVQGIEMPSSISTRINHLEKSWKDNNSSVPCAVYSKADEKIVDRIVSRTHAKGETAGRDQWTSVARARYSREKNHRPELGLDMLEKYLAYGKNLSSPQAERWAGDFPLTVLDEALKKLTIVTSLEDVRSIVTAYPKKNKRLLDRILIDIGTSNLGFKELRDKKSFWGLKYGLVDPNANTTGNPHSSAGAASGQASGNTTGTSRGQTSTKTQNQSTPSSSDPRSVEVLLRDFKVQGKRRHKLSKLVAELKSLKIRNHPHAFCFLLRSIFELSAKAYCEDHKGNGGPKTHKKNGQEKNLATLLSDITDHITNGKQDKVKLKSIHGAMTELGKPEGILSVTSMNQLVHNPSFSVSPHDISIMFGNLFPLLEELNN